MRTLRNLSRSELVALATGATALGFPPTTFGLVPASWASGSRDVVPEVELEIWAPGGAVALTAAVLHAARLHALTFATITLTGVTHATGILTKAGHGLLTGDGPLAPGSTLLVPGGLDSAKRYWAIKADANTFKLAASFEDAMSNVPVVLTDDGTGVITIAATADTDRVYWEPHDASLGVAGNGTIALGAQAAYSKRVPHSPRIVAYALVGTLDANTVSAALVPIEDSGG